MRLMKTMGEVYFSITFSENIFDRKLILIVFSIQVIMDTGILIKPGNVNGNAINCSRVICVDLFVRVEPQ